LAQSKVSQLCAAIAVDEDVVRLDVAVKKESGVNCLHSVHNIREDANKEVDILSKSIVPLKIRLEIAVLAKFVDSDIVQGLGS
jgi:hypothetical protein